ncbi:MAG: DNA-3-methyladenine glycosylase [bacterium]|nr:DNA-3-methyladenine glycosylase [bacterium]
MRVIERDFYRRDTRTVAVELLNKLLLCDGWGGRIVEVEAYGGASDPGSHACRGPTERNAAMFGPPGHLYVYFIYGTHWCCNAVCNDGTEAGAVLVRALAPLFGLDEMRARRPAGRRDRDLCSGPAKLCQALGIDGDDDGADLVTGDRGIVVGDDGTPPPAAPGQSPRIGLSAGTTTPWRWYVPGEPNLSRPG